MANSKLDEFFNSKSITLSFFFSANNVYVFTDEMERYIRLLIEKDVHDDYIENDETTKYIKLYTPLEEKFILQCGNNLIKNKKENETIGHIMEHLTTDFNHAFDQKRSVRAIYTKYNKLASALNNDGGKKNGK